MSAAGSDAAGPRESSQAPHLTIPVRVTDPAAGTAIRFDACSVSVSGAFLPADLLFEVGELVGLEIDVPGGRRIVTRGRVSQVVRDTTGPRAPGMELDFIDLSPDDRAEIASGAGGTRNAQEKSTS